MSENPALGYRPSLDGLRAVAITAVVAFHATGVPAMGWMGVDLFFVLSGFLITTILLEEHRAHGRVSLRGFYRRRALRLLPAFLVMLAVVGTWLAVSGDSLLGIAVGGLYLGNIVLASGGQGMPEELAHLWSLAAEEQFYLLWPLLLIVLFAARRRLAAFVLIGAVAATVAWTIHLYVGHFDPNRIAFGPDTRGVALLVGCALAFWRPKPRLSWLAVAAALGLFFYDGFGWASLSGPPIALFAVACGVVILRSLEPGALATALALAPVVYVGRISYSLYLWHPPALAAVGAQQLHASRATVAGVALAVAAAMASYHLVEKPFLRLKRRKQVVRQTRLALEGEG